VVPCLNTRIRPLASHLDLFFRNAVCSVRPACSGAHIYRFVSTKEFEPHCDTLFGTDKWRAALTMEGPAKERFLRELYQKPLLDPADGVGAKYVRFFTMKDDKKKTIYDLC
jgi:hypothetical protein